jgi:predicted nucleic acid-binding protein
VAKVFIDTNIAMYAAGTPHSLLEPCQRVILAVASGQIDAWTDVEVFQEILYRYMHIHEKDKGLQVFDHFYNLMIGRILAIEETDIQQARLWVDTYPSLSPRDLIHLAVMSHHQISEIVTAERGFESISHIIRTDPQSFS